MIAPAMTTISPDTQPGDPEQLARVVQAAERFYENSRQGIVVYWDEMANRYRFGYQSQYRKMNTTEVVRIPK
jgi:hypothetical protein